MADLVWNLIYIILGFECSRKKVPDAGRPSGRERREVPEFPGGSRNKTRLAKVVVVANSKQKVVSSTHKVVKYAPKNLGYDYTLYWKIEDLGFMQ